MKGTQTVLHKREREAPIGSGSYHDLCGFSAALRQSNSLYLTKEFGLDRIYVGYMAFSVDTHKSIFLLIAICPVFKEHRQSWSDY